MKAYKIKVGDKIGFAGTQSEATSLRNTMLETSDVKKKDTVIEDVEIPTDKKGLLAFVNEAAKERNQLMAQLMDHGDEE